MILVLCALRMLRQDSRRQYQDKRDRSLAKAELYVADHFSQFYQKQSAVDCSDKYGGDVSLRDETRQHACDTGALCCSSSESSQPFLATCRTVTSPQDNRPEQCHVKKYKTCIPQGIQTASSYTHCKRAMCNIAFHENLHGLADSKSYISVSSPALNGSDQTLINIEQEVEPTSFHCEASQTGEEPSRDTQQTPAEMCDPHVQSHDRQTNNTCINVQYESS